MCKIDFQSQMTGFSVEELQSSSQKEELCFARFACSLCLYKEGLTYKQIANIFNRRSHSTIMSGIKVFNQLKEAKDPKLTNFLARHKCYCTNGLNNNQQ